MTDSDSEAESLELDDNEADQAEADRERLKAIRTAQGKNPAPVDSWPPDRVRDEIARSRSVLRGKFAETIAMRGIDIPTRVVDHFAGLRGDFVRRINEDDEIKRLATECLAVYFPQLPPPTALALLWGAHLGEAIIARPAISAANIGDGERQRQRDGASGGSSDTAARE